MSADLWFQDNSAVHRRNTKDHPHVYQSGFLMLFLNEFIRIPTVAPFNGILIIDSDLWSNGCNPVFRLCYIIVTCVIHNRRRCTPILSVNSLERSDSTGNAKEDPILCFSPKVCPTSWDDTKRIASPYIHH